MKNAVRQIAVIWFLLFYMVKIKKGYENLSSDSHFFNFWQIVPKGYQVAIRT